ncbi:TolC family protein [Microbulbifer sp. THAF38]|uniref:TolC family protein n=1 Tax=Microbulbifer sp. THAF38 TaxID=2587856 RepID=UPI0012689900|nr:TolC family protein [Microbulbifer sp. THAF38]QFT54777.1 Cobalt-zinc-cadmium resistance protein CzcC precursor [Microbulbifer sp. THAF38]
MEFFRTLFVSVICRRALWPLVATVLCIPVQGLSAQRGEMLTLSDAIELTLAQNPQLAVFPLQRIGLNGAAQTAALRPAVNLGFESEYEYYGPGDGFSAEEELELTVYLSSVIELGGKRQARIDAVSAQRDLLIADEQAKALELLAEVLRRYAEVLAAEELLVLAKEKVALAEDTLEAVTTRVNAAASSISERMRAESALADAKLSEQGQQAMIGYYKHALSALWGDPELDFKVDSRELYRFGPGASFEELYARAKDNPTIARFASEERVQASKLRIAQTRSKPDVEWYLGYRKNNAEQETAVMGGVTVPLFTGQRSRGSLLTAMSELDEVVLRRDVALLQLYPQLYLTVVSREQALRTFYTLQDFIIPKLREALKEVDRAYRRGRDSYVELISAREELLAAERSRIKAAQTVLLYGAEIEQLTAGPLGPPGTESRK